MNFRLIRLATLLLLAACGEEELALGPRDLPSGIAEESSLLRLPSQGGSAAIYSADSLLPLEWQSPTGIPAIARPLGIDLADQMVYAVGDDDQMVGLDLLARRARPYLTKVGRLSGTADGVVLGLDSARRPVRFANRTLTTFRAAVEGGQSVELVRAPGSRLSAYAASSGTLQVLAEEGELRRFEVPAGQLASSWFGDLLAVTTDSGLVLVKPGRDEAPEFVRIRGAPIASAFSPSAHRIYVARGRGDLVVLDRFSNAELAVIDLDGAARALRPDRSGRWLLARAEAGDSVWVIDLVARRKVATIAAPWAADLPLVSGGRSLITRDGDDVVGWDLSQATPQPLGRLAGAASDVFLAIPWVPQGSRPEPVTVALTPDLPGADTVPSEIPSDESEARDPLEAGEVFVQVTSTQNEGYAKALADQLRGIGFRASVHRAEEQSGGPFKVLVGPYPSRDEAEADGKRLGMPYFITTPAGRQP